MQRKRLNARHLAGAARRRVLRPLSRKEPAGGPRLSVVVPVYNVEDYVAECLDSVLGQTLRDLEVIAVDDGSTDGSPAILEAYAAKDRRVHVVRRRNGGLGAARNTGLERAVGTYLTFVDSDDTIPEDAYRTMVDTLDQSGSDLAVGRMVRLTRGEERPLSWSRRLHGRRRVGISVEQFPKILRDFYTPNKVYRRSFWTDNGFRFREVGLFEDQPVITQVYCAAERIDVLTEVTYRWRLRDDGSSLTQNMLQAPEVRSRREAIRLTHDVLEEHGSAPLLDAWRWSLVQDHFPRYLTNTTPDGFEAAVAMVRDVLGDAAGVVSVDDCDPDSRLLCYLALTADRDACLAVAGVARGRSREWPVVWEGDAAFAQLPGFDTRDRPRELFRIDPWLNEVQSWLVDCRVSDPETLEVRGRAYLEYVDPALFPQTVTLIAHHDRSGAVLEFETRPDDGAVTSERSTHSWIGYRASGFRSQVPLRRLAAAAPEAAELQDWRFEVRVEAAGRCEQARVWSTWHGSLHRMSVVEEVEGRLARARWSPQRGLTVTIFVPPALGTSVAVEPDGKLRVEALVAPGFSPLRAALIEDEGREVPMELAPLADGRWSAAADLERLSGDGEEAPGAVRFWRLVFDSADAGRRYLLVTDRLCAEASGRGVALQHNGLGQAQLRAATEGLLVSSIDVEERGLVVEGRLTGARPEDLHLRLTNARTATGPADVEGVHAATGLVRATVPYGYTEWGIEQPGLLPVGNFALDAGATPIQIAPEATHPQSVSLPRLRAELVFPQRQRAVLRVRPPLAEDERGKVNRRRLVDEVRHLEEPLREAVLFQCLRGDIAGDSQLAVDRELARTRPEIARIWATVDHTVAIPEGSERVIVDSRAWFRALGCARWIIVNHELPRHFVKRPGQIVVQTYHGHPYKLMGLSRWRRAGWTDPRIDRALESARSWDFLLAPSPLAEQLYAENFPVPARILTVGHPRNDVLVSPEADGIRDRTRTVLGLEPEDVAVLYAPTWRDYSTADPWKSKLVDFLDPEEFTTLGDRYTLLLRGHPAHQRHPHRAPGAGRVVDVTDYPEINDLILAADVGLFDYSSIRFDFSVTGKPMIFFLPDEELYLNSVGTLLDFAESTPGPHAHTFAELRNLLLDIDHVREEYAAAYEKFRARFNPFDDGDAAARLVAAVFGPPEGATRP